MSSVTPFQRAHLAAAQPLTAVCPQIPVGVTPELARALRAAVQATQHDLAATDHLELRCLLLQVDLVLVRRSMS